MNTAIEQILQQLADLQSKLQQELHERSNRLYVNVTNGRVEFERRLREQNRALKIGLAKYISNARLSVILTAPLIYALIIPFVLLDIFVTVYQAICFPIYNIPKVKRSDYLNFDRMKLDYLNAIEKFNCAFCSYGNGIIAYVREVAARTEQHWCPIKHAHRRLDMHNRYPKFTEYGDGEQYRKEGPIIKKAFEKRACDE